MTNYDVKWAELEERRLNVAAELESLDWRAHRRERERGQIGIFYRKKLQASLRTLHQRKAETRRIQQALQQKIDENLAMTPARRDRSIDELKKRYGSLVESMKASWLDTTNQRAIDRLANVERSLQQSVAMHEYEQDLATREKQIKDRIREQRQRVRSIQEQLTKARNDEEDETFAMQIEEQRQEAEARARAAAELAERERQRELSRLQLAVETEQRLKDAVAQETQKEKEIVGIQAQMVRTATSSYLLETQLERRLQASEQNQAPTSPPEGNLADEKMNNVSGNQQEKPPSPAANNPAKNQTPRSVTFDVDTESESSRTNLQIVVDPEFLSKQKLANSNDANTTVQLKDPVTAALKAVPLSNIKEPENVLLRSTESQDKRKDPTPEILAAKEEQPSSRALQSRQESQAEPSTPAYELVPKPMPKPSRLGLSLIGLMADPITSSEDDFSEQSRIVPEKAEPKEPEKPPEPSSAATTTKNVVRPKLKLSSLISGEETDSDDISLELKAKPVLNGSTSVAQSSDKPTLDEFDF